MMIRVEKYVGGDEDSTDNAETFQMKRQYQ